MATSATIKIEGFDIAKVYKHWDGNSTGTKEWLEEFNRSFAENRGDDPEYKFAQLLRSSSKDANKYGLDESTTTGWGVIAYDQDYSEKVEYTLMGDGSVTIKYL